MNRMTTAAMACVLVVAAIGAVPAMGLAQETTEESDVNESAATAGELLTGILGVQGAELKGEMNRRTFGVKVARAASDEARADVVGESLTEIEAQLAELEDRKQELATAKENGSISNGTYNAQMAVIAAQTANAQAQLNASENASDGLPADLLESKDINASAIQMLKDEASELTGPKVAAIARSIAGPDVGISIADEHAPVSIGQADGVGQPGEDGTADNATSTDDGPGGPSEDGNASTDGGGNGGPPNGDA